ncbi:MAG TPA: hypothetical protein VEF36_03430 [Roseiarcus sp.]|nr:hypothetical protein [Roseiarcus sp.]
MNRIRFSRAAALLRVSLVACLASASARADDDDAAAKSDKAANPYFELDTKNLFGFLEGADVGDKGDRSVEFETTGAFGLRNGRYASIEQELIYETTPIERLGVEFGAHFLGQDVADIGLAPDFHGVNFGGLSWEWRFVAIARDDKSPFQLTLTATPEWARVNGFGQRLQDATTSFRAVADSRFFDDRLYVAGNLFYAPERTWTPGQSASNASTYGASAASSYRVSPDWMFGAESDLFFAYDGLAAAGFLGRALYLGPTLHYQISRRIDLSGAYLEQVAGKANGDPGALDLTDFSRRLAKLRLEVAF